MNYIARSTKIIPILLAGHQIAATALLHAAAASADRAALFRRVDAAGAASEAEDLVERGPLRLDTRRASATWNGQRVDLTVTELWIVHALAHRPGHVKDREQLMGEARMVVDDSTVTSHVKRIRRKLVALDPGFDRIESVYGMGYRWREE